MEHYFKRAWHVDLIQGTDDKKYYKENLELIIKKKKIQMMASFCYEK